MSLSGYAAGSAYDQAGSGANFLCLVKDPIFRTNEPGVHRGHLQGVEYENPIAPAATQREAPCAVCEAPRCAVFMMPGRDECYDGWVTEYAGWLASSYDGTERHRSEFICVDRDAQNLGTATNNNQALWYPVRTVCGSLPCGVYPNGHDTRCAVCSR